MDRLVKILIIPIAILTNAALFGQKSNDIAKSKDLAIQFIDSTKGELTKMSDSIWKFAEIGLEEYKSSKLLADYAEDHGFKVERNVSGLPTAFIASYGSGKPIIGITGEYDALPGLSQKAIPRKEALYENEPGHGCGHNLLGVGALGAALAVKELMDKGLIKGTIRYYGTPAEENYSAKLYLARDGYFNDLDVCLNWHPMDRIKSYIKNSEAVLDFTFKFNGKPAHAAADPWDGKSALDGVESFLDGINLLREHVKPTVRIHYVITDGGKVPNVVPDYAEVWLWARDNDMGNLLIIGERIKNIAKGAALIADVKYNVVLNNGMYNVLANKKGSEVLQSNLEMLGPINYTDYEIEFAHNIQENAGIEITGLLNNPLSLDDAIYDEKPFTSDIGDVSWIAPVITLITTTAPESVPWHSWCVVASGGMSIGHKGMIYSSKALAMTMVDLYKDPNLIIDINKESKNRKGSFIYQTMLPEGPPPISGQE
jgi:aminobenzoyl-glutamate utilization protein B